MTQDMYRGHHNYGMQFYFGTAQGVSESGDSFGIVLQEGIGDTIRVSLTPEPGGDRTREVIVAQEILQSMGFRAFLPQVVACPGCGRTTSTTFQEPMRAGSTNIIRK